MATAEQSPAYCPNCTKNVPHIRTATSAWWQRVFQSLGRFSVAQRIGPWYCFHCQKKTFWLPAARPDAPNYRIVDPEDPVDEDPDSITVWLPAKKLFDSDENSGAQPLENSTLASDSVSSATVEGDESPESNQVLSDIPLLEIVDDGHPARKELAVNGNSSLDQSSSDSFYSVKSQLSLESVNSGIIDARKGLESKFDFDHQCSLRPSELESLQRIDTMAKPEQQPLPEAEPVGNFIRDRSLILRSTRMHRVSVKYRDSVVKRILTGKVSLGQLTAEGEYTEAELISWIADKVHRMQQQIELLENTSGLQWTDTNEGG